MSRHCLYAAAWMAAALVALCACRREPLYERVDNVELRLDVDLALDDPVMWKKPTQPTLFRALFYDPVTHEKVGDMHCGPDGGRVYGVQPGRSYDVLVYNDDFEYTRIRDDANFNTILAYTDPVDADAKEKYRSEVRGDGSKATDPIIVREPDHLLVARNPNLQIPYLSDRDTTFTIHAKLSTILDSYYIQVDSLKGLENISTVGIYLSGHSSSNRIGPNVRSHEAVTLYFPCYVDLARYCLRTTFNTFGKLPYIDGDAKVQIVVMGDGGRIYNFDQDITEQYNNPDHRLILTVHGTIEPREQGGFVPEVHEWEEEEDYIDIK